MAVNWPWSYKKEDPVEYLDDVYRYSRARLGNREDAEDVAMEVVQSLSASSRQRDLRIYMIGIARRKIADRLRRHRPTVEISENGKGSRFDHLADETMHVAQVLSLLTDDQREALTLKYVVGMSSEEVASALEKSPEAVDSLLQRGRTAFAREWDALLSEQVIS